MKFFISHVCQFLSLIILFSLFGSDNWLDDKFKDLLFFALAYVISIFIGRLTYLFRPLNIQINMNNSLGENESTTNLHHTDGLLETQQYQRTINLKLIIKRRGSIWWKILIFFLKKNDIHILINSNPSELHLQAIDDLLIKEIKLLSKGFSIRLNDLLFDLSKSTGEYSISRTYDFIIADHTDFYPPRDSIYKLESSISLSKTKKIVQFLCKSLIQFEGNKHDVKFFRR